MLIKDILKFLILILGIIILCWMGIALTIILLSSLQPISQISPISKEDATLLCKNLEIEKEPICNSNENIYPPDFSVYISNRLELTSSTYEDAQNVLGIFQMNVDVDIDSNTNTFLSHYDINRDGKFDVRIRFEGSLESNTVITILFAEEVGF